MSTAAKAVFIDKEGLTDSVVMYKFRMVSPEEMNFLPGQYIEVDIGGEQRRKYSIASSPLKSNREFEIVVDLSPQGSGSTFLESLEINRTINFLGEIGEFTIPDELNTNLFFIANGTGISPLKSMIDSIILNREDYEVDIYLYFGCRTPRDILFPDIFSDYRRHKHIDDYHIYFSQDVEITNNGELGTVDKFISRIDPQKLLDGQFFICGGSEMIKSVEQVLLSKNVPKEFIYSEKHF